MDMSKVVLKFKMNAKGTHHIAYCDEYPTLQGIGPSEGQATANFWRAYNTLEDTESHQVTMQKKVEKVATEVTDGKKKKKAA